MITKFILILSVFGAVSVGAIFPHYRNISVQTLEDTLKLALQLDPDTGLSINEFVDKYNYSLETHEVITEDRYILTLHRIPHSKLGSIEGSADSTRENSTRPVAVLMHGMTCSSKEWIWQGPNASLAFQLVDQGYDVWLLNARGNAYSNKHVTLTTEDPSFWNFSYHEIGYYDIASSIDYVLNVTNVEKVTYVGHSRGNAAVAILTSSKLEYNEKLNLVVMFSPALYVDYLRSPIALFIGKYNQLIKQFLESLDIYSFQRGPYLGPLLYILCNANSPLQGMCILLIELLAGFDVEQIDKSKLTVLLTSQPSGNSYKDIEHFVQRIGTGKFDKFNYGNLTKNIQHYGSAVPPSYNISKMSAPIAVYYSKNDFLNGVEDTERFISELQTEIADQYLIEYAKFNHLDFLTAKDVKTLLYDRAVEVILKYNPVGGR